MYRRILPATLVLALALAACSSHDEGETTNGSPSPTGVADTGGPADTGDSEGTSAGASQSPVSDFDAQMEAAAQCMQDRGWNTRYNPADRSLFSDYAIDQADLFRGDYAECVEGKLPEGKPVADMTDEEIEASYTAQVERNTCIANQGYPVDEQPSLETYIDQLRAGTNTWGAGVVGVELSESEYYALLEACPLEDW